VGKDGREPGSAILDPQQADWALLGVPHRITRHFLALQLPRHLTGEVFKNVIRNQVSCESSKVVKG